MISFSDYDFDAGYEFIHLHYDEDYDDQSEEPPTEITTEKVVIEKKTVSPLVTSCNDQKIWCKHADCGLDNVKRSCQKTCGLCNW